jgi:hypothetical protein
MFPRLFLAFLLTSAIGMSLFATHAPVCASSFSESEAKEIAEEDGQETKFWLTLGDLVMSCGSVSKIEPDLCFSRLGLTIASLQECLCASICSARGPPGYLV